jgi:hypothetical protein
LPVSEWVRKREGKRERERERERGRERERERERERGREREREREREHELEQAAVARHPAPISRSLDARRFLRMYMAASSCGRKLAS